MVNDVDQIDSSSKGLSVSPVKTKMSVKNITARLDLEVITD